MMIHCHFAVVGLSNSYLIGPKGGGDAMLIDPSRFDIPLLNMIEDNHYYIRWVLVTHNHENHIRGLKTLLKIYDAKVYGAADEISGVPTQRLHDSQPLELPNVTVMPLEIRGHSSDCLVYKIENDLFTGDILSAGRLGSTNSAWARANMVKDLKDKIFSLPPESQIYPGHGPPSSLEIENITNGDLRGDGVIPEESNLSNFML